MLKCGFNTFLLFAASIAMATPNTARFNGSIFHTCNIKIINEGTFGVRSDYKVLNSRLRHRGGSSGNAEIFTSSPGYSVSIIKPTRFNTQPVADTTPETFNATYEGSGATNIARTSASRALAQGTTNINVDMLAKKSGTNIFEAGNYQATVVLRCE